MDFPEEKFQCRLLRVLPIFPHPASLHFSDSGLSPWVLAGCVRDSPMRSREFGAGSREFGAGGSAVPFTADTDVPLAALSLSDAILGAVFPPKPCPHS